MDKWHYHLVDVFTDQAFGGNQLAVFTAGQHVPVELMQKIATELKLSETTFVLPPQNPANNFWMRIFTPAMELPTAGHPTVGTAFVLRQLGLIPENGVIQCEQGVGVISVELQGDRITMQQPLPTFGTIYDDRATIAAMLSLTADDLDANYPIQVVSCGVPLTYIPLKNMTAIQNAQLRLDIWEQVLKETSAHMVFVFTQETILPASRVHSRMFSPKLGIAEDPATGIAAGPLGSYLVKYGIVQDNPAQFINEQGFEMGRPSLLHIGIEQTNGAISRVTVGGECVAIGEGTFYAR